MDATAQANDRLQTFLLAGLALGLLGGIIAAAAWPRTEDGPMGYTDSTGSAIVSFAGLALTWVGSLAAAVGVVGYGVKFGRIASPTGPQDTAAS